MKLTVKNGKIMMTLNCNGIVYKETFDNQEELSNFCKMFDEVFLKRV